MAEGRASAAGRLYVVSTPIGNLGDITRRAVDVLRAASSVVAEDTRRTRVLLSHLQILNKSVRTLNAHSSEEAMAQILERLLMGEDVALVTDAGTPAVSDPGRALVALAAAQGLEVCVVPGPSAVTAAVALSALVEGPFSFIGFFPRQGTARRDAIERMRKSREAVIFFESAQRIEATLNDLAEILPERAAFVGRELTKLHEEGLRGTLRELGTRPQTWRGEIVVVVAPNEAEVEPDADRRELVFACLRAAIEAGASPSHMARALAEQSGLPRRELYEAAIRCSESLRTPSETAIGAPSLSNEPAEPLEPSPRSSRAREE